MASSKGDMASSKGHVIEILYWIGLHAEWKMQITGHKSDLSSLQLFGQDFQSYVRTAKKHQILKNEELKFEMKCEDEVSGCNIEAMARSDVPVTFQVLRVRFTNELMREGWRLMFPPGQDVYMSRFNIVRELWICYG